MIANFSPFYKKERIVLSFLYKNTPGAERARRTGRRQVLIGPFPPILHRKIRKYVKYSRIFLYCLNEKCLAQNCYARKKQDFCVGQGEKRRNTGAVFQAFSTMSGAKRSFLRCRIPILRALKLRERCQRDQSCRPILIRRTMTGLRTMLKSSSKRKLPPTRPRII